MRPADLAAMAAAVAISGLGMAFHTVREFGVAGLFDPASGMIPVVGIQIALLAWWLRARDRTAATWLYASGLFQLIGGAIISVLPLPILPFVPLQTIDHYLSHVVLGIAQVPLVVLAGRARSRVHGPSVPLTG